MRRDSIDLIYLLATKNKGLSYKEVSEYFSLSERAIRYEVEHADALLKSNGFDSIFLNKNNELILNLDKDELDQLDSLVKAHYVLLTTDERITFILVNSISKEGIKFAYEWSEILEVSKSTMDSDVKKAKQLALQYDLKLFSKSKEGYQIEGNEWSKRVLLNTLFLRTIEMDILLNGINYGGRIPSYVGNVLSEFFNISELQRIYSFLKSKLTLEDESKNQVELMHISVIISIWLQRLEDERFLTNDELLLNKNKRIHTYDIIEELKYSLLSSDVEISFQEQYFIAYYLEGFQIINKFRHIDDWVNIQVLTLMFVGAVEEITGIEFSSDPDLFERLNKHMESLSTRIDKSIVISNPLEAMIIDKYNDIYSAVSKGSSILSTYFKAEISASELSYITIHFSATKEKIYESVQRKFRIAVICGHGIATGALLSEKVKKAFPVEVVAVLDVNAVKNIKTLDIDFAISTIELNLEKIKTLAVSPLLSDYDKKIISKYMLDNPINNLNKKEEDKTQMFYDAVHSVITDNETKADMLEKLKQLFAEYGVKVKEKGFQPMIKDVLKSENIILHKKVSDWKEAIVVSAQPLLDDGTINQAYVDDMIESVIEYGPYIVLDKGIALAHAKPGDNVRNVGLSVLTLTEPVNFDHEFNDPVEIVFCLAAIDGHSHLKIMKTLVQVINERRKLDLLINAKTTEEFSGYVREFEEEN